MFIFFPFFYYNHSMINFIKKLLDYIYKKKCYFCARSNENNIFCSSCYDDISFLPFRPLDSVLNVDIFGCCFYKNNIKKLIRGVKYHNQKELAFHQARIMYEYWQKTQPKEDIYTIIPVPIYKSRIKKRKYNHMLLVAKEFCNISGYYLNEQLVERIKDTVPQYKLSKKEREKNLKDAFKINIEERTSEPLLIIDDITTTGSTLLEIIKELNKNNLHNITAIVTAIPEKNSFYIY